MSSRLAGRQAAGLLTGGRRARARGGSSLLAIGGAFGLVVVGVVLLAVMLGDRVLSAPLEAEAGGLELRLDSATWLEHDMGQPSGGFQMPQSMMPGAPAPDEMRLTVSVELRNPSKEVRQFHLQEFTAQAPDGTTYPARLASFELDRLGPGMAMTGTIGFDLPVESIPEGTDPDIDLLWERAGAAARLPIPVGEADHSGH